MIFRPQLVLFYGVIHVVLRKHKIEDFPPPHTPPPVHILYRKNGTFYKECTICDTLVRTYYVNGPVYFRS